MNNQKYKRIILLENILLPIARDDLKRTSEVSFMYEQFQRRFNELEKEYRDLIGKEWEYKEIK